MSKTISIESRDFWVKVVGMLQQNWALVDPEQSGGVRIHFITDTSAVFDAMNFPLHADAIAALKLNGFKRYADDEQLQSFLRPPEPPFHPGSHPNGPIYSSGRFWKT
jgi:hypothetical protein